MTINEKKLKGVLEIVLDPFVDNRGIFMRTFEEQFFKKSNLPTTWVQENHSINKSKFTIRGLHYIKPPHTDGKLIRCIKGELYDVVVDLRKNSQSFGQWESIILTEKEYKWIYIPKGFAHGFCTLKDDTEILYKHDSVYNKGFDSGILWNDVDLKIEWPCKHPIISEKDTLLESFNTFIKLTGGL